LSKKIEIGAIGEGLRKGHVLQRLSNMELLTW
jgi:hypothetical protein